MYRRQRPLRRVDIDFLVDIDSKCFDRPWRLEHWEHALNSLRVMVISHWGTPIAYVVARDNTIVRFAVKPNHRRKHLGSRLFQGLQAGRTEPLNVYVPEDCLYRDPRGVGGFLNFNGFVARTPIENETVHFIWRPNGLIN